ncbi:MAG TPA: DUF2202 domain-containing protein, partial [Ignavibacteriaceae bacterium]|nr:DUF2202 domain-containing protein [Ignavibacteriaceae bacterium]
MKYIIRIFSLFIITALLSSCSDPVTGTGSSADNYQPAKDNVLIPGELSPEEAAGIIFMRQEEKLARDVYIVLYQVWEYKLFDNISKAEQNHMEAVKRLIVRYDLEDPIVSDEVGVFSSPVFQQMFDDFVLQGQQSLLDAMQTGQAIEQQDIEDLENQLSFADNQ